MDCICGIPDHLGSKSRFENIISNIATKFSLENIQPYLGRRKSYSEQKSKTSAADRSTNIKGAFSCNINLNERKVILIDDILTTGATLTECADTLFKAGASEVIGAVLAANQLSRDYWLNAGTELKLFSTTYSLRGNAKNLTPFFTNLHTEETLDYNQACIRLQKNLNSEIIKAEKSQPIDNSTF